MLEQWRKRVIPYKLANKKNITPQRNPEHILIASSTFNFKDSVQIEKEFAKHFPLKGLIYAFSTTRGNVHLEFVSKEEADRVFENWKPEFLFLVIQQRLEELFQRKSQIVLSSSRMFR